MKLLCVLVAVFAVSAMGDASVFKSLAAVLEQAKTQEATLLPWILPTSTSHEKRSFCFVGSESFFPLAQELSARGHSVAFAGSPLALPEGVRVVDVKSQLKSTFGETFDESLALYETFKAKHFDVIVFPASLAYMSIEAKKAGLAFEKTALVVSGDGLPAAGAEYHQAVTRFMAESAIEMADSAFITQAYALDNVRFEHSVSVWRIEGSAVPLLEAVKTSVHRAPVDTPLVSAIVTSFNRPQMVRQAVESLQAQTYKHLEIIVVDDGSTHPDMPALLRLLEAEGVRVIRQSNQYLGASRNNAARVAKGSLLVFLDDDNVALPSMVQVLVRAQRVSGSAVVVNAHYLWKAPAGTAALPSASELAALRTWCPVGPSVLAGAQGNVFGNANFLMERETFFAVSGFTEDRSGWEDYEFHAKCAIAGVTYVVVPEPLMLFRQHDAAAQMSFNTDATANQRHVLRPYRELLRSAAVSGEAISRELASRAVTGCTERPTVQVNADCVSSTLTAVVQGTTAIYGQSPGVTVASALILTVNQGGVAYLLSTPADYTFTATAGTGTVTYVVSFVTTNNNKVRNLLTNAGNNVETTVDVSFAFTDSTAPVLCPRYPVVPADFASCNTNVCFHKDTIVEYNGKRMGLDSLRAHPECAIPHVVTARGVSIHTACAPETPLRLTKTHLVYTSAGLRKAQDIRVGHVLYGDINQQVPCAVTAVDEDLDTQEFFGLNCLTSTVLASNIKTSTFGDIHTIPAMWMAYVGRVIGIERASRWGSSLANIAHSFKLL